MKPSTINLNLTNTAVEAASMFSKVPDGDYVVSVAHSIFKDGKNPGAAGLQIGYMVEEGAHKGKLIQDYINIANNNEQAVEIGHRRLKAIMTYQERKSFALKTDADLISRNKFMISTVLEKSMFKEREIESVSVKKIFAIEKKKAAAVEAHVEEETEETPPWMV